MSPKLQSVRDSAIAHLDAFLSDHSENIETEFQRDIFKGQRTQKPACTTINFAIKVSHENKPCKFKLRYGSAQSDEAEETLKDPNQLELPAGE